MEIKGLLKTNWWPISHLHLDMKLISKVQASCLKSVISTVVNQNQVAYVNNRFKRESGRLISDVLEITNILSVERLLMTVDMEKGFDSINHCFLMFVLKKFGFGNEFRKCIQTLMKNPESCLTQSRVLSMVVKQHHTLSWNLELDKKDPISAYLFVIAFFN